MSVRSTIRPHQATLLVAGLATVAGLLAPVLKDFLLPVAYLNTHLHEMSHAIVALLTGAEVEKITVNADGSGVTPVMGGSIFLTASAGYTGASIFGAFMIAMGGIEKSARWTLGLVCGLLCLSMVFWVRGDGVGLISGYAWIVALGGMSLLLRGRAAMFACQFLGLQQCLNSLTSLFALVKITADTEAHSDATILAAITGIPAIVWALAWAGFGLWLVGWTLRKTWQPVPIKV